MYKTAVGVIGIDPKYFLDNMSFEAFMLASEGYYEKDRSSWEQTRLIAYNSISPYLKHRIKLKEFLPMPWDDEIKQGSAPMKEKVRIKKLNAASMQFKDL